jgi:D-glycero-beta-D-manno-heptose 1-phosphate adenylyltransferase
MSNIKTLKELISIRKQLKRGSKKVVFTNGCFDIIHAGHVDYLCKAKELGNVLIVGLNTDDSVKRIKGDKRPIMKESERAIILANLKPVDYVVLFDEETPIKLIEELVPDVLVKGADWDIDEIIGKDIVINKGGKVRNINYEVNQSTTDIIKSILSRYKD